jgi:hypothetical protein
MEFVQKIRQKTANLKQSKMLSLKDSKNKIQQLKTTTTQAAKTGKKRPRIFSI